MEEGATSGAYTLANTQEESTNEVTTTLSEPAILQSSLLKTSETLEKLAENKGSTLMMKWTKNG